ncbi:MAG: DUF6457 domain-containing protein [Solirubrobacteraceae bacterium]
MNAKEWLTEFASRLGVDPPTAAEFSALLDLAAEAAHGSERVAAPVACWVAARAGRDPKEAIEIAREVSGDS